MKQPNHRDFHGRPGAYQLAYRRFKAWETLEKIKASDRDNWSQPSAAGALQNHELEREFESWAGEPCPAWPKREWTA